MSKEKKTVFIHQPQYKGGPKELTKFIYAHLKYPQSALEAQVEGIVFIEYDIDYHGNVVETRVLQGLGHGCDEEACRVVALLKFDVGRNRGVHVLFHQKIKVQFKLPKVAPASKTPQPPIVQVAYTVTSTPAPAPATAEKPVQSFSYTVTIG